MKIESINLLTGTYYTFKTIMKCHFVFVLYKRVFEYNFRDITTYKNSTDMGLIESYL